jgi:hypothetical protein
MSDYDRTTRECLVSQLDPEILQALRSYFLEHQLGNLEAETLLCCETISRKKKTGRLGSWLTATSDTTIHTGILLTSQWLIWVRRGDKSGTLLTAADLKHISVKPYTSLFAKDAGLEVFGYLEGSKGPIRGYIGMGPDVATQKFCDAVKQEITRLNPPNQKTWPKWLGG